LLVANLFRVGALVLEISKMLLPLLARETILPQIGAKRRKPSTDAC
tara:strand:+ start:1207 stop:1344 length:138 start_codon:yes stop_codon:yes gene_type:complete